VSKTSYIKYLQLIYGIIFIIFSLISIITWFLDLFGLSIKLIYGYLYIPPNVGYGLAILSIGVLSIFPIKYNDPIKINSALFIATILATILVVLEILTAAAHYIDVGILYLSGETGSFNIIEDLGRIEIYMSPYTLFLLIYSLNRLKRYTI